MAWLRVLPAVLLVGFSVGVGVARLSGSFAVSTIPAGLAWVLVVVPCFMVACSIAAVAWNLFVGDPWNEENFFFKLMGIAEWWPPW